MAAYRFNAALRPRDDFDDDLSSTDDAAQHPETGPSSAETPAFFAEPVEDLRGSFCAHLDGLIRAQALDSERRAADHDSAPALGEWPAEPDHAIEKKPLTISADNEGWPTAVGMPLYSAREKSGSRRQLIAFVAGLNVAIAVAGITVVLRGGQHAPVGVDRPTGDNSSLLAVASPRMEKLQARLSDAVKVDQAAPVTGDDQNRQSQSTEAKGARTAGLTLVQAEGIADAPSEPATVMSTPPEGVGTEERSPHQVAWPAEVSTSKGRGAVSTAWSSGDEVKPVSEPEEGNAAPTGTARVVKAVNLRAGPDNSEAVLTVVPEGTVVEVAGCRHWCEVVFAGHRGWIYRSFLGS
jgi:hypothetical protein